MRVCVCVYLCDYNNPFTKIALCSKIGKKNYSSLLLKVELSKLFSIAAGHKYFFIQQEKSQMLRMKRSADK